MGAGSAQYQDQVGIGWRPEISADLLIHQEKIDCLEVVIESLLGLPRPTREALKWLGNQLPIDYHGVSLCSGKRPPRGSGRVGKSCTTTAGVGSPFLVRTLVFCAGRWP